MGEPMHEPAPTRTERPRPPRWALPVLLTGVGILIVASNLGAAFYGALVNTHPALLLTLNSSNKMLVGVTNQLDALTYYGIGFARLLVADPLFYLLGLFYGDAALRWIERKMGDGATTIIWFEKAFKKARYPIVLIAPNNPVCLLAGATGMRVPVFLALNATGTIGRLYLARVFGEAFQAPIKEVNGFLERYRWPLLAVTVGLLVLQSALKKKPGQPPGELGSLAELKQEIESSDDDADGSGRQAADDQKDTRSTIEDRGPSSLP